MVEGETQPRIGSYAVERELGRGGMGEVFLVRDVVTGAVRALKLLRSVQGDAAALQRFRREFRAMSRLTHPNVLRVHDSGVHEGRPWFAMDFIEGVELRVLVREWAELEPSDRFPRVISVLVQTARALAYIHERGIVHHDVSCTNLMVTPDGTVKLMDFGLAVVQRDELDAADAVFGTVAYMAPEQIRGEPVDARSDLYALGVVLYQLLTGRKPFQAHTVQAFVDRHLHEAPKPPRELDPLVPELLEQVCLRLLAKSASERYASANHVLGVLGDVEDGRVNERWPPRLVGRGHYRSWLRGVLDDVASRRTGGAALIHGGPGSGKTRLLELAELRAERLGLPVLRGTARAHDRPFGAFMAMWPDLRDAEVGPELLAVFEPTEHELRRERYPVIAAFRDLVARRAPCVLLLDNMHEADGGSRDLVEFLVRNAVVLAELPIVVIVAWETLREERGPLLVGVRGLEIVACDPFQRAEVEELVVGLVSGGPSAVALARRLYDETGGAPGHIADMLRGLVEDGVIRREGSRWRLNLSLEAITEQRLPLPDSLRALLADRLQPLPALARDLARTVALTRRGVELDVLLGVTDGPEAEVLQALGALLDAGVLLEERRLGVERVDLSHDRFRDLLLDELSADERRARHQRLGERLERDHRDALGPVVEDLAWHFEQAGLPPKGYAYLVETARKHLTQSSFEEGVQHLDRAAKMEVLARPLMVLDEADRRLAALLLERGRAHFHLGRWELARADVSAAAELARLVRDPALVARAATEQGKVLRNLSEMSEAERLFETALAAADASGQAALRLTPLYHLAALRWARGDLAGADKQWTDALALAREVGDETAEAQVYNGLGILAFCRGQSAGARQLLERSAELFDRVGMVETLAVTRANLIELYKLMGQLNKALRLADRTVARSREVQHRHGVALGLVWRARVIEVLGRHDEARRNAQEGLQIAIDLGTKEEQVLGLRTLVQIQLATGNARFASARVDHLIALLAESDVEGVLPQVRAMQARCLIARGEAAAARAILGDLNTQAQFPHIQVRADLEAAIALRELGEPAAARGFLMRALDAARSASFRLAEMAALQELIRVTDNEAERADWRAKAASHARMITSGLERADGALFDTEGAGAGKR